MKKVIFILTVTLTISITTLNAQVTNGLVAKWSFNNGVAYDESGNGHHGTINGAILTTDRFGNANHAFEFPQNGTISINDNDSLDGFSSGMSISFWVNSPTINTNINPLITKFSYCGGGVDAYSIRLNSDGTVFTQIDDITGFDSYQSSSVNIANSDWHHVTLVWDRPNVYYYIDGVLDALASTTVFNFDISNNPDKLMFGHPEPDFCGTSYEYGEKLDDIRIYNRPLNANEVDSLFNEPNPMTSGINDVFGITKSIDIYPNPTKDQICFSVFTNVQLTNLTGQIITDKKNVNTLDLSDQPAGIYFLTMTKNNGQLIQTSKVMKK